MNVLKKGPPVSLSQTVSIGNTIIRDSKLNRNRVRTWCFTLNNYTEEDCVSLSHNKWHNLEINKCVFQEELGLKKLVPHLQGVVQFKNQVSFSTLKELDSRIHWEKCKNLKASIKYCSKKESRNGKCYVVGDCHKHLWKDMEISKGIDGLDTQAILDDLRRQMMEDFEYLVN